MAAHKRYGTAIQSDVPPTVWHIASGDIVHGPFSLEQLLNLRRTGRLTSDSFVHLEGWNEWRRIDAVEMLRNPAATPLPSRVPLLTQQTSPQRTNAQRTSTDDAARGAATTWYRSITKPPPLLVGMGPDPFAPREIDEDAVTLYGPIPQRRSRGARHKSPERGAAASLRDLTSSARAQPVIASLPGRNRVSTARMRFARPGASVAGIGPKMRAFVEETIVHTLTSWRDASRRIASELMRRAYDLRDPRFPWRRSLHSGQEHTRRTFRAGGATDAWHRTRRALAQLAREGSKTAAVLSILAAGLLVGSGGFVAWRVLRRVADDAEPSPAARVNAAPSLDSAMLACTPDLPPAASLPSSEAKDENPTPSGAPKRASDRDPQGAPHPGRPTARRRGQREAPDASARPQRMRRLSGNRVAGAPAE